MRALWELGGCLSAVALLLGAVYVIGIASAWVFGS